MDNNRQRNAYENYINMYPPGHEPSKNAPYPVDDIPQNHSVDTNPFQRYAHESKQGSLSSASTPVTRQSPPVPQVVQRPSTPQQETPPASAQSQRDLSDYSAEAVEFYEVYDRTVKDANRFTKDIQLKWCETLLQYAFKPTFLIRYNINAERLKRDLTEAEMQQNKRTILEHALRVLTKLTQLNHPSAMYLLGTLYSHHPYINIPKPMEIVSKNDAKALDYYRRAADLGHKDAMYRTGVCYEYGRGVNYSVLSEYDALKTAQKYYEMGALTNGDSASMYKLGMFYLKGLKTRSGEFTIKRDSMQALYWFRMAVKEIEIPQHDDAHVTLESVSPQAMLELGKIYGFEEIDESVRQELLRNGITQNKQTSIKYYYRCAHDFDYPQAQFKLGHFYEFGEMGLPVIPKKSIAWYAKSSMNKSKPNPLAMVALSGWYLTGAEGVLKPNDKEAYKWVSRASKLSDGKLPRAEYALGFYLEKGLGCEANLQESRIHYEAAARNGHPKAIEALRRM
ncbi:unnamed protein product [Kluyveromyces dobzhanskii CBS 2104]|uniref:WGS project CCBQ000000000 data, contig 00041 n=1 Tax=Kluyveromyces dobzhanskii CBS 2104 TaxID=1427455 RepID=A0A0A8L026_9SACH|nr:unnamed protein product [Kluyveromyces dobzhanskii CBS 2104]